jgi:hypothetical protein
VRGTGNIRRQWWPRAAAASPDANVTNDTGLATATGGTTALTVALLNATGTATAGGGTTASPSPSRTQPGRRPRAAAPRRSPFTVANVTGAATAAGGTSAFAVTLTNTSGAATAGGGATTLAVTITNATGGATAGGGTSALAFTITNAAGASTGSGGTTALTFVYANASGTATAGGGTSTVTIVSGVVVTNVTGAATAAGGTSALTFIYTNTAGAGTGGGGTSTATVVVNVANVTGLATASGGTTSLAFTYATTGGLATASGGASALSIITGDGGFIRVPPSSVGGFTRVGESADPFVRVLADGPDFVRDTHTGGGFTRVSTSVRRPDSYGSSRSLHPMTSAGSPAGPTVGVASANGVVELGGLTEGVSYTAFGSSGIQEFVASNQEDRLQALEAQLGRVTTAPTDGSDATAALRDDHAAALLLGTHVLLPPGTYRVSGRIHSAGATTDPVRFVALVPGTVTIERTANTPIIEVTGSRSATVALTANVAAGDSSLTVASLPTSLAAGDYVAVRSSTLLTATGLAKLAEVMQVQSITGAGPYTINFYGTFEEAYTTAATAWSSGSRSPGRAPCYAESSSVRRP